MMDSVFSLGSMIYVVQKLRQEKAECKKAIIKTKHRGMVLERRVEKVARQMGIAATAMEEKVVMMTALKGRVEARQKMFN